MSIRDNATQLGQGGYEPRRAAPRLKGLLGEVSAHTRRGRRAAAAALLRRF